MRSRLTVLDALADRELLGALPAFRDLSTWRAWLVFLCASYGLPFAALARFGIAPDAALATFQRHTGRTVYDPPAGGYSETVAVVGRQSGKSQIAGVTCAYEAMVTPDQGSGPDLYAALVAQDARASLRTLFAYAREPFQAVPVLQQSVASSLTESVTLTSGVVIAVYPCRPAAMRGIRAQVVVADEFAHFRTSEGYPTDVEMLRAVRPTLATTGGRLLILSSPDRQTGALYELHRRHFGRDDSRTLVWQATAPEMNPTLPADYLARMAEDDPEAYRSEVLGEFRQGVTTFLDADAIQDCVDTGVRERPRSPMARHVAYADAASGSGKDAFAIGIAHKDGDVAVLDVLRTWQPPFDPAHVIREAAQLLRQYGLSTVTGDRYAPGFVESSFRQQGITYRAASRDTSSLYLEFLPVTNAGRVRLMDDPDLLRELRSLERRRGQGRDRIDHRPGGHDDRAVAAAGAVMEALAYQAGTIRVVPVVGL